MLKRLPHIVLMTLVLAPAGAAQTHYLNVHWNSSPDAILPVRLDVTPEHSISAWMATEREPSLLILPASHSFAKVSSSLDSGTRELQSRESRSMVGKLFDTVTFQDTPFADHVTMPMMAGLGGRVAISGYYSLSPMENVLMGLPGAGNLPAWGVSRYAHLGVNAPQANESMGLSLTMRLGRSHEGSSTSFLKCLGGLFGRSGRS